MRTVIFDFLYHHPQVGEEVAVEVEFILFNAVANPDSDWDAKDHIEITDCSAWLNQERLSIDIPDEVVYSEISARIRAAELTRAFDEEDGGF